MQHSTASIGVTLFTITEDSVDEMLKKADIAMYQAKASGRNTLLFVDPDMQSALAARAALEVALGLGIQDRQFILHYQPQVDGARDLRPAINLSARQFRQEDLVDQVTQALTNASAPAARLKL